MADETTTQVLEVPQAQLPVSFAALDELLSNPPSPDLSVLPKVYHPGLQAFFYVGPMNRSDYSAWCNLVAMEKLKREQAANPGIVPLDTDRSDAFLLTHAVWTSDGQNLSTEHAKALMTLPRLGPGTQAMVEGAREQNPSGEMISMRLAILWSKAACDYSIWRILFECGLGKAVLDHFAASATPEEKEWANRQIQKAQEAVAAMEPYIDTKMISEELGITFRDAAQLNVQRKIEELEAPSP